MIYNLISGLIIFFHFFGYWTKRMIQELFPIDDYQVNKYSYSRVDLFRQCKLRYKLKYIDNRLGNDQKDSFYLSLGRSSHKVLKEYYDPINKIKPDLDPLINRYWISSGYKNSEEELLWKKRTRENLLNFINQDNGIDKVLEVESCFEGKFKNYTLTSILDRINTLDKYYCEIIEYKFGDENSSGVNIEIQFQWLFHYLASSKEIFNHHKREIAYIKFCYLDSGNTFFIYPTPVLVQKTTDTLMQLIERIENEDKYEPSVNKYCGDCRFDIICPLMKKGGNK